MQTMAKTKWNNIGLLYGAIVMAANGKPLEANELCREFGLRNGYTTEDRFMNLANDAASRTNNPGDLILAILSQEQNVNAICEDLQISPEELMTAFNQDAEGVLSVFAEKAQIDKLQEGGKIEAEQETINVTINGKKYKLTVAKTDEEKETGLQNVESMDDDEGMFFDYRDNPETELSFWMKDTTLPLDIIFVSEGDDVIAVKKGVPESEDMLTCKSKRHPIVAVIELNQGSGVKVGDEIEYDNSDFPELEPNKMYVIGSNGLPQAELVGNERIMSRIATRVILRKAKKAYMTKKDSDYKSLGRYVFNELTAQDERDPQYVESRKKE